MNAETVFNALRAAVRGLLEMSDRYAAACGGKIGGMDLFRIRSGGPSRPTENAALDLAGLAENITRQEAHVRELEQQANAFLGKLRNPMSRRVIVCRCYKAMSWRETAAALGFADKRSAIRAYRRAMDELA